jgi:hypothetical protein
VQRASDSLPVPISQERVEEPALLGEELGVSGQSGSRTLVPLLLVVVLVG